MKIEIGELLLVSWLRHVKECQIVQTNWKASLKWELKNKDTLLALMQASGELFSQKYGYKIYKGTVSLEQLIKQAEIDVVGLAFVEGQYQIYVVDVAFHEGGLSYGSREETVARVIKKCLRSAMCVYGYYGMSAGTIIFTAPKMNPITARDIEACIEDMHVVLRQVGLDYEVRIITNEDFSEKILEPVLNILGDVADTSELFMRSVQLVNMFKKPRKNGAPKTNVAQDKPIEGDPVGLEEMSIGVIVRQTLGPLLEEGVHVSPEEIAQMQTEDYSKQIFGIAHPLLQKATHAFDKVNYYALPLHILGEDYFLFKQWYERHRSYLVRWLDAHKL